MGCFQFRLPRGWADQHSELMFLLPSPYVFFSFFFICSLIIIFLTFLSLSLFPPVYSFWRSFLCIFFLVIFIFFLIEFLICFSFQTLQSILIYKLVKEKLDNGIIILNHSIFENPDVWCGLAYFLSVVTTIARSKFCKK